MTLKNRLSWIKASNDTQIKWAHQYLRNNGAHIDIGSVDRYEDLKDWDARQPDSSTHREMIRKMKAAWAQKKLRDKPDGRKTQNFILSTKAKASLDSLAKRQHRSISNTLENLIAQGLDAQKAYEEQLKTFKKKLTEELQAEANSHLKAAIAYGELYMSTLDELCECKLALDEADKTEIDSSDAGTKKKVLFKKKRKEALESLTAEKRRSTGRINKYLLDKVLQYEDVSAPPDAQQHPKVEQETPSSRSETSLGATQHPE